MKTGVFNSLVQKLSVEWLYSVPSSRATRITLYIMIGGLGILQYANTFTHEFAFDDVAVLSGNDFVQKGIEGIPEILTTGSWDGFDASVEMRIYRPLQLLVLAVQYEIFELDPMGYHVVQVVSFAILSVLLLHHLMRLFERRPEGAAIALVSTLLYLTHPIHVEVVANIKGNGDLLAVLFGVIALRFADRYGEKGKWIDLLATCLIFFIALMFKEVVVTLVGVALLSLYFFRTPRIRTYAEVFGAMITAVVAYLLIRHNVFGNNATTLENTTSSMDNVLLLADSFSQELGTRMFALGKNLKLLIFPYPLQLMYVRDSERVVEALAMASVFPALLYLGLLGIFLMGLPKKRLLSFAVGFYLVTIFLFSHLIFSIPNLVSERWLFLPSMGACIALGILMVHLIRVHRVSGLTGLALLFFGFSGYTLQRNAEWESNYTLGRADVWHVPNNYNALSMAGAATMLNALEGETDDQAFKESALYFERVVRINPLEKHTNSLGLTYENLEQYDLAAYHFAKAASVAEEKKDTILFSQAKTLLLDQQYHNALTVMDSLLERHPEHANVYGMKGVAEYHIGRLQDSKLSRDKALELDPQERWTHEFQGRRFLDLAKEQNFDTGLLHKSVHHFTTWLYSDPDANKQEAKAFNTLGQIYEVLNQPADAAQAFVYATQIPGPLHGKASFSAARNYMEAGLFEPALALWDDLQEAYPEQLDVQIGQLFCQLGLGRSEEEILVSAEGLHAVLTVDSGGLGERSMDWLNRIGVTLKNRGLNLPAAQMFVHATRIASPIQDKAAFSAAETYHDLGEYDRALQQWRILYQKLPGNPPVVLGMITTLLQRNQSVEARELARKFLTEVDPEGTRGAEDPTIGQIRATLIQMGRGQ